MSAPLAGIRVTEFTWVIAGPLMTKYLALLGAEVIRVESEKRSRNSGRFWSSIQGHPCTDDIRVGGAWTDPLTAATGAFAILAALHHRRRIGDGQFIDLSMVEATLCGIPQALMDYSLNRRLPARMGNRDPIRAPHGCYPCRGDDRWIAISVSDDAEWQGL